MLFIILKQINLHDNLFESTIHVFKSGEIQQVSSRAQKISYLPYYHEFQTQNFLHEYQSLKRGITLSKK